MTRERRRSNSIAQYWSPCSRLVKKMIAEVDADTEFSEINIVAYRKHTVMLDLTVPRDFLCGDQASHVPDIWTQITVFSHLAALELMTCTKAPPSISLKLRKWAVSPLSYTQ